MAASPAGSQIAGSRRWSLLVLGCVSGVLLGGAVAAPRALGQMTGQVTAKGAADATGQATAERPGQVSGRAIGEAIGQAAGPARAQAQSSAPAVPGERVLFNRDIRPLLADHCFQCHGPDARQRQAGLRLDTAAGATASLEGRFAIRPGQPAESELLARIDSTDPLEQMPPPETGKPLSAQQRQLLRRWIEEGAVYQPHWAFLPPQPVALPKVGQADWVRNPIDRFVLQRLEAVGLTPAPPADPMTLLRRVALDLTGLPPTPEQADAFAADPSDAHYRALVDQLLASPRFAERMAMRWLDGARYADTSGYQSDGERFMWRWRDWVLEAYQRNLPFDQFTLEQLAGDLLPNATLDQHIATGFNRNHRGNGEGGIIPEEYAVEYVVDRVETTATVWLGLTVGCCRCHDHKFDPVSQREFYSLYAFFNSIPEYGRAWKYGNSPPVIPSPTRSQQAELAALEARRDAALARARTLLEPIATLQSRWEAGLATPPADWNIDRDLVGHWPLANAAAAGLPTGAPVAFPATLPVPTYPDGPPTPRVATAGGGTQFDGTRHVVAGDVANFGFYDRFTLSAWVFPDDERGGAILSRMTDATQGDGYSLVLRQGRLELNLVKRWLDDALRVETTEPLVPGQWHHVTAVYDGSRVASGVQLYVDGEARPTRPLLDLLNQTFATKEPLRLGAGHGPDGRWRGGLRDVRVHQRALAPDEVQVLAVPDSLAEIVAIPSANRTLPQAAKLAMYYRDHAAPAELRDAVTQARDLTEEVARLIDSFPTTMVMRDLPEPRPAHVLLRGVYDRPGEQVERGTPAVLPPWADGLPRNRLGLARWLVDPRHPLTSRVAVNRLWQMLFGTGLVKTVDDFGSQGEWPSHPELLDWLALEFVRPPGEAPAFLGDVARQHAFDVQALLRLLVTSATYRQSSIASPELLQRDPDNRWLARGPRGRLAAEMIRDQALLAAGLLVEQVGGPSVKPYQPDGLWKELSDTDYVPGQGADLYRRGLYTFWKRTVAPPMMVTFDAAGRETCIVRETRTNTPLQALTLMNETSFVEAARGLAQRALLKETDLDRRLTFAFRHVLVRPPLPGELATLRRAWQRQLTHFQRNPGAAVALLAVGESPRDTTLDPAEHATLATLCGLLLNLDETLSRE
ncbi:MAG: DUF1553 domain-containing protein [Planctomycetaceae bacterium]